MRPATFWFTARPRGMSENSLDHGFSTVVAIEKQTNTPTAFDIVVTNGALDFAESSRSRLS